MPRIILALLVTVVLGLVSRLYPVGWLPYDKSLGDVLYAVAAYLLFALILNRQPAWLVALAAIGWCLAVEFFKLTDIPAQHGQLFFVRWILGTTFSWHNIGCYLLGVCLIVVIDAGLLRPKSR